MSPLYSPSRKPRVFPPSPVATEGYCSPLSFILIVELFTLGFWEIEGEVLES
jgi:hypothetical protein